MKIIVHPGFHKTGTTAIQTYLKTHRDALAAAGFIHPDFAETGDPGKIAGNFYFAKQVAEAPERVAEFRDYIAAQAARGDVLFLSAESMIRHAADPGEARAQSPAEHWRARIAYVERLREVLPGNDVEVVFTLRDVFPLAESYYQENVKKTMFSGDFTTYLRTRFVEYDIATIITIWQRIFPKVTIRSYEADMTHPKGIVGALLADYCPSYEVAEAAGRHNVSLQAKLLDILRRANAHIAPRDKPRLIQILDQLNAAPPFDAKMTFWTEEARAAMGPQLEAQAVFQQMQPGAAAIEDHGLGGRPAFEPASRAELRTALDAIEAQAPDIAAQLAPLEAPAARRSGPARTEAPAPSAPAPSDRPAFAAATLTGMIEQMPAREAMARTRKAMCRLTSEVEYLSTKTWPTIEPPFQIETGAKVFTIGSCFARNIEEYFDVLGFELPTLGIKARREEWAGRPNGILDKYNPPSILHAVEWAREIYLRDDKMRPSDLAELSIEVGEDQVVDLQLAGFVPVTRARHAQRRAQVYQVYRELFTADTVMITLGMTECWKDLETGKYIDGAPLTRQLLPFAERFEFHNLDVNASVAFIDKAFSLIREVNADAKFVITTSPVPLIRTFTGLSCVSANGYSKSTLRSACGVLDQRWGDDLFYFPSYEIVSGARSWDFWQRDCQHLKSGAVAQIVHYLVQHLIRELGQDEIDFLGTYAFSSLPERREALALAEGLAERSQDTRHHERLAILRETFKPRAPKAKA
ncbi:GSCFA domain-containing protein [Profundibacterium mesophilum]|uniref:Lipoprotein n=1 Tax=Profundibacterium mesophilum KAUST100406-0324 TaxID=1037889 RepID=A0A921NR33_9RHOB|nr:GSCFA domain-containing protein [Profundibacterium mesophilum]KAF0674584.1 putative lipoprotein [Profundibacterium mesophilum KAUST100406-0324]